MVIWLLIFSLYCQGLLSVTLITIVVYRSSVSFEIKLNFAIFAQYFINNETTHLIIGNLNGCIWES